MRLEALAPIRADQIGVDVEALVAKRETAGNCPKAVTGDGLYPLDGINVDQLGIEKRRDRLDRVAGSYF